VSLVHKDLDARLQRRRTAPRAAHVRQPTPVAQTRTRPGVDPATLNTPLLVSAPPEAPQVRSAFTTQAAESRATAANVKEPPVATANVAGETSTVTGPFSGPAPGACPESLQPITLASAKSDNRHPASARSFVRRSATDGSPGWGRRHPSVANPETEPPGSSVGRGRLVGRASLPGAYLARCKPTSGAAIGLGSGTAEPLISPAEPGRRPGVAAAQRS
jgi:hypothetical protein